MKEIVEEILHKQIKSKVNSIKEIKGLGSVNRVFDIESDGRAYIVRLNEDQNERLHFRKEEWCIENVSKLGVPSPEIVCVGTLRDMSYMIQKKINGVNGTMCSDEIKLKIWESLGRYTQVYRGIKRIDLKEVEEKEFHKTWKSRLVYNIKLLNDNDSLLNRNVFSIKEQREAREALLSVDTEKFDVGLVHGDLCPRNVIWNEGVAYLLDWGTAEINVIPHIELATIIMSKEATEAEVGAFIHGCAMSEVEYKRIEPEVNLFNFLHWLDKYRWAEDYAVDDIEDYERKVNETFSQIK